MPLNTALAQPCGTALRLLGDPIDITDELASERTEAWAAYHTGIRDEFVIVWQDDRNGDLDIFGQRIAASDGSRIGNNFVVSQSSGDQQTPSIAHSESEDEYLVTWRTDHTGSQQAFARRFSGTANAIAPQFFLAEADNEGTVDYAPTTNEFLYVGRDAGIHGQRVVAGDLGGLVDVEFPIDDVGTQRPGGQVVYNAGTDEFLAVWRDEGLGIIKGQRIASDGTLIGSTLSLSTLNPSSIRAASIAADPVNGRYFMAYGLQTDGRILGQFIDGDGTLLSAAITLTNDVALATQPHVSYNANAGAYCVVWNRATSVQAQLIREDGLRCGAPITLVEKSALFGAPRVSSRDFDSEFLVYWSDSRNFGEGQRDIFAQRLAVRPGPAVQLEGDCPGIASLSIRNATPRSLVAILFAFNEGSEVIPGGFACAGTQLGLDATTRLVSILRSDRNGEVTFGGNLPTLACGGFIQVLDAASCQTSNVVSVVSQ